MFQIRDYENQQGGGLGWELNNTGIIEGPPQIVILILSSQEPIIMRLEMPVVWRKKCKVPPRVTSSTVRGVFFSC